MTDEITQGEAVRVRAESCQKIVDEALANDVGVEEFLDHLKKAGASPAEAADYGQQYSEQKTQGPNASPTQGSDPDDLQQETTPDGLTEEQQVTFREVRDAELTNAAARANQSRQDAIDAAA